MTCSAPYSGAGYTVCGCASNQYYDQYQEMCQPLKNYLQVCRDSTECADAYTNTGYCGVIPGGSKSVCNCIYNYYGTTTGSTCLASITVGSGTCSTAYPNSQCEYNSVCVGTTCTCGTIRYPNSNGSCLYKGYQGDPCTTGTGCWSGTCTSNLCT
jgi:hypothetical protein